MSRQSSRTPRKGPKSLTRAKTLVAPWLEKLGLKSDHVALFEAWDRLLGAEASKARAAGVKGDVLYVDVDHSARLHDLTLRKPQLVKKLNGFFGASSSRRAVSDIILRLKINEQ